MFSAMPVCTIYLVVKSLLRCEKASPKQGEEAVRSRTASSPCCILFYSALNIYLSIRSNASRIRWVGDARLSRRHVGASNRFPSCQPMP